MCVAYAFWYRSICWFFRDVKECIEDAHVTKEEVVGVLRRIEDFGDVRMIRLKPLLKHNPDRRKPRSSRLQVPQNKRIGIDVGGFVGLKDPEEVKRGYYDLDTDESSTAKTETASELSFDDQEESCVEPKKARKKCKPLGFVESSSADEEGQKVKKKKRGRPKKILAPEPDLVDPTPQGEESVIQISTKDGKSRTMTILNLCPELHPIEPDYHLGFDDSSSSTSTSMAPVDEECDGIDLLLSAANMIRLEGIGSKCEAVEGSLQKDSSSLDRKRKKAGGATSKSSSTSVKRSLGNESETAAKTHVTPRDSPSRTAQLAAPRRDSDAPPGANYSVPVPSSDRKIHARFDQRLAKNPQNVTNQKQGYTYEGRRRCTNDNSSLYHDQFSSNPGFEYRFNQQVPQDLPLIADLRYVMPDRHYHIPTPYSVASLPSLDGVQLSRDDLIIRNGRALLAQMFPPNPMSYKVVASLADESYRGNSMCCDASIQSHFSPEMSVAHLTKFLVEKVNPMKWLLRICSRASFPAPSIVRISYGHDLITQVNVANGDVKDAGRQVSVGLRMLPQKTILSPLDNIMTHLHPGENTLLQVELVTRCVNWPSNASPESVIELGRPYPGNFVTQPAAVCNGVGGLASITK